MDANLTDAAFKSLGIAKNLLVELGAVFQLINKLRDKAETIGQGYLYINILKALLEGLHDLYLLSFVLRIIDLNFLLKSLEARFKFIERRIERIFSLLLL